MKSRCRSPLTTRLTFALIAALSTFWLLSAGILTYSTYVDTKAIVLHYLRSVGQERANYETRYLRSGEYRAERLLRRWLDGDTARMRSRRPGPRLADDTGWFEEFARTQLSNRYLDSFVYRTGKAVLLYPAVACDDACMAARRAELHALAATHPARGILWGEPIYDRTLPGWRITVAAVDRRSDGSVVMAGYALRLDRNRYPRLISGAIPALLSRTGAIASQPPNRRDSRKLQHLVAKMARSPGAPSQVGNYFVVRDVLPGPALQWVTFYPVSAIAAQALKTAITQVPVTLVALLLLSIVIIRTLHGKLGRRLRRFVAVINATGPDTMTRRLPVDQDDELGRIAHAYNGLLDALSARQRRLETENFLLDQALRARTLELSRVVQRVARANRAKGEILSDIGHDLRTPLTAVMGALELLQPGARDGAQRRVIDTAHECGGSLLTLLDDALAFARYDHAEPTLRPTRTAPLALVDQAMTSIRFNASGKGLRLNALVTARTPRRVTVDALAVRHILADLLDDAVDRACTGTVRLQVDYADKALRFTIDIQDFTTPRGSDAQNRADIAANLSVACPSTEALASPVSAHLARLMRATVGTRPGAVGWETTLRVPANECMPIPEPLTGSIAAPRRLHAQLRAWGFDPVVDDGEDNLLAHASLAYLPGRLRGLIEQIPALEAVRRDNGGGKTAFTSPWLLQVLIVDDIAANREIIGEMVRLLGHEVSLASSGAAGLRMATRRAYDLVLLDLRMPVMDGLETARRWRAGANGILDPECALVVLTANADGIEEASASGINGVMPKPITLPQMAAALQGATQHQLARGIELPFRDPLPKAIADIGGTPTLSRRRALAELASIARGVAARETEAGLADMLTALHAIKGCAGQAGLHDIGECARLLEQLASDPHFPMAAGMLELQCLIDDVSRNELGADDAHATAPPPARRQANRSPAPAAAARSTQADTL